MFLTASHGSFWINEMTADKKKPYRWLDSVNDPRQARNVRAFLDTIAYAEGTILFGNADGYNVIVSGQLFDDYTDHPRVRVHLPRYGVWSTAAGRYQLLSKYFDYYSKKLDLPGFDPASQDEIACWQIREQGAWGDVLAGRIESAINKCRNIWASFPGAGYGQREVKTKELMARYALRGGEFS